GTPHATPLPLREGAYRACRESVDHSPRSHRREEVGAGALLELAPGLGAETHGIGGSALPLRLVNAAAVGLGDKAVKAQSPGSDDGMARDRRGAGGLG